jgi:hypothetical protein
MWEQRPSCNPLKHPPDRASIELRDDVDQRAQVQIEAFALACNDPRKHLPSVPDQALAGTPRVRKLKAGNVQVRSWELKNVTES